MGISKVAKKIILDELDENVHPEKVEDVIFWALQYYAENKEGNTLGKTIANYIVERIQEEEKEFQENNN